MDEKLRLIAKSLGEERVKFNQKLTQYSYTPTTKSAKAFYIATSERELEKVLDLAHELKIPFIIIGSGTKLDEKANFNNLVIKNRSSSIRVSALKGAISKAGIGVKEALVEVDSGVSIGKLNEFLTLNDLEVVKEYGFRQSTIGGSIFTDSQLQIKTLKIKVWYDGETFETDISGLKRDHIVLSVVFKFKAKL